VGVAQIVFVHGWACDRSYWRHQMDAFPGKTVVAVDLAGHGDSGTGRGSWTMPAFGADVVAVMDDLHLDDVVLVGHSMGGDVILEAALVLGNPVLEDPDQFNRALAWIIEGFR
jgi:pimeloyl-ACP methyl ester carboxylesterase